MTIKGLQKLTLLDFPGHTACTVFFGGCNLRCPFCHNSSLVTEADTIEDISDTYFFEFLGKRCGLLDGVAITGGEPLMEPEILPFINKIKEMGYRVKLDTNGTLPGILRRVIEAGAVDYIAMDIKNSPDKYSHACGITRDVLPMVKESISLLMHSGIPYEFRTTVVPGFHTEEDIAAIGQLIGGAERYYLQGFTDSGDLIDPSLCGTEGYGRAQLERMAEIARGYAASVAVRGV